MNDSERYDALKQFLDAVDAMARTIDWELLDRVCGFNRDGASPVFELKEIDGVMEHMLVSPEEMTKHALAQRNELGLECEAAVKRFCAARNRALKLLNSDLVPYFDGIEKDIHSLATNLEQAIVDSGATFICNGAGNCDPEREAPVQALDELLTPIRAWCNRFVRTPPNHSGAFELMGTDPLDRRFPPMTPTELSNRLECGLDTLRKSALKTGAVAPGRGQRSRPYSSDDVGKIVNYLATYGQGHIRAAAKRMLSEKKDIRKTSEDTKKIRN